MPSAGSPAEATTSPEDKKPSGVLECRASSSFLDWLHQSGGSLIVSTYQAGLVLLLGSDGRTLNVMPRRFPRPMGIAIQNERIALATKENLIYFANAPLLAPSYSDKQPGKYDALYLPRASYHVGPMNVHDLAFGKDSLWLVNTRFCCLSVLSKDFSFIPRWQPKWLTQLAPEDRCHLNGLTMVNGKPGYVTALGETDTPRGWVEKKATGGVVIDVSSREVVVRGLSMPHSPRWYQNQLLVLNSGMGELVLVDQKAGKFNTVCRLPAYLRGLSFVGPYALIGMCQIREKHVFGNLPVQERNPKLLCGVAVVDLRNGETVGTLEFTSGCTEIYDVHFLPKVKQGMILNTERPDRKQAFTSPEFSYWVRPQSDPNRALPNGRADSSQSVEALSEGESTAEGLPSASRERKQKRQQRKK